MQEPIPTPPIASVRFDDLDKNNDGIISREEFEQFQQEMIAQAGTPTPSRSLPGEMEDQPEEQGQPSSPSRPARNRALFSGPAQAWLKRRLQWAEGTGARTISEEAESVARPLLLPVCGSAERLEQFVKKRKQTWQDPSDGAKGDLAEVSRRPPLGPVPSKAPLLRRKPRTA
eukprot:s123_g4.t1